MDNYKNIPKVELHRHLEGSLRVTTMLEIAKQADLSLPASPDFARLVQVQEDEPQNFTNFLSKFETLRKFYRSKETIQRFTQEAVQDAAQDGVIYLELTFTPVALSRIGGFQLGEVMDWVAEAAHLAAAQTGIQVRLLASANRHESPDLAFQVAELSVERKSDGIVGLSMVGNEAEFPARPFLEIFRQAKQNGLSLVIHAGEWAGAENVREAIEVFDADRIGHGVRVLEDPSVVETARCKDIPFEVCLTSNLQSGVIGSLAEHPLPDMIRAGLNVSLHTDDPGVSNITLSHEYRLAVQHLGVNFEQLSTYIMAAAQAAFLPADEKIVLSQHLRKEFSILSNQS